MLTDTLLSISSIGGGEKEKKTIDGLLLHFLGEIPLNGSDSFSSSPVWLSHEYVQQMKKLCQVLDTALHKIVSHYFKDERIRAIYQLDAELENILEMASEKTYEVGMYRPDFLYDTNGQPRICEIGARYPLNGWMLSHYLNLMAPEINQDYEPVPQQHQFIDDLYQSFSKHKKLALVHENEKGTEIFYLLNEFRKKGMDSMSVKPSDLFIQDGKIYAGGEIFSQFILEMDREELKKFKPEVLKEIIANGNYFNDVRTLILVHDKRILAVLYDEKIMRDYLSEEDYHFLHPYLIPTYALHTEAIRHELMYAERNWVLKLNSGGRGIGAYVKNGCPSDVWQQVIREQNTVYMAQHYIDQLEFYDPGKKENAAMHIVGMLLCRNGFSYGPGLFRGSAESIINVAQGRGIIFPSALKNA